MVRLWLLFFSCAVARPQAVVTAQPADVDTKDIASVQGANPQIATGVIGL